MKRVALVLLVALVSACGSTPTAPIAPANLVADGNLSVSGCQLVSVTGVFQCAAFSGIIRNTGTGCAANVRGTTVTTSTSNGQQVGSAAWSYLPLVRAGEQISYSGGAINVTQNNTWVYATTPAWDNVRCQ